MNTCLKILGFQDSNKLLKQSLDKIQKEYEHLVKYRHYRNDTFWEIKIKLSNNIFLVLFGYLDLDNNLVRQQAYPYLKAINSIDNMISTTHKKISGMEFLGNIACDKLAMNIIFKLSNHIDILQSYDISKQISCKKIFLSAWANTAKILLPIQKTHKQVELLNMANRQKEKLFEQAKNGDVKAIEYIAQKEDEIFNQMTQRLDNEDLYSIVDTSFLPIGPEDELYKIVGTIIDIKKETLSILSNEEIYIFTLYCNGLIIALAVNSTKILGEAKVGRRLKASICLQGKLEI